MSEKVALPPCPPLTSIPAAVIIPANTAPPYELTVAPILKDESPTFSVAVVVKPETITSFSERLVAVVTPRVETPVTFRLPIPALPVTVMLENVEIPVTFRLPMPALPVTLRS